MILDFRDEFLENDESIVGGELLDKLDFDEWLRYVQKNSDKRLVSPDWVVTDVFFAVRNTRIVGVISFRHRLNDFLENWGHIGYSVRPSCRGHHIASCMLGEVIGYARGLGLNMLQLSCYADNAASRKTIESSGAIYVRSFIYLDRKVNVYRIILWNYDEVLYEN